MARTVQVFKDAMIDANQMREAQGVAEQRQREQRSADMHKLADQFEGVVGQIIGSVSTALDQAGEFGRRAEQDGG